MHYFYDGCSPEEFSLLNKKKLIRGVTTNISFTTAHANTYGHDGYIDALKPIYNKILKEAPNTSFSVQAIGTSSSELISSADALVSEFADGVDLHIKVPASFEFIDACLEIKMMGVKVNSTCVTSFLQATAMLEAGVDIVSFFWGKMTDEGLDPIRHILDTSTFISSNRLDSLILCGSIRQTLVIQEAFRANADIVTLPLSRFQQFATTTKSDEANLIFANDWTTSGLTL